MPQRCMCPNFNWEYPMVAALQRRKLNISYWREGILSPRTLVRGNPARASSRPRINQNILGCSIIVLWVANVLIPFLINSDINPFYASNRLYRLYSLAPRRCGSNFKSRIFKLIIQNICSSLGTHCEITLKWMSQDVISEKSTLVQVMTWCRQVTSHYRS